MAKEFSFGRKERFKSRKQIDKLFAYGQSISCFPLRVTYKFLPTEKEWLMQAGVTASKRFYKKAVDRNRLKRLMREAYRLQKSELSELLKQKSKNCYLFFIYTDKTIASYDVIKEAMQNCLKK